MKWYRKAADQDDTDAQFNLGNMYYKGRGVPQDYTEAAKWIRNAAEGGHVEAQSKLGYMYDKGHRITSYNVCYTKLLRCAWQKTCNC